MECKVQEVAVFWDDSVVPALNCSAFHAARFVCKAAETAGVVKSVKFYGSMNAEPGSISHSMYSELKYAGVTVVNTTQIGRGGSAIKTSLTDALMHALDNSGSGAILFVSADRDVCYTISLLRMRGYQAYLLCPANANPISEFQLPNDPDTSDFLDPAPCPPPGRPRGPHDDPSPPSSGRDKQAFVSRWQGGSSPGDLDAPLGEIDAFRETFTHSQPKADTRAASILRPQRSISLLHCNEHPDPEDLPFAPNIATNPPTLRPRLDLKGKSRAIDADSTIDTPIVLTATSMSESRSNSIDSIHRCPPTSISTAPTSATPWYRPDFKMSGGGTFIPVGHEKHRGLKDSTTFVAGMVGNEGLGHGPWSSCGTVRSASGSSTGSATPTRAASPVVPQPRRGSTVGITPVVSHSDPPVSLDSGNSVPSPVPERIQIHASPPAPNPVAGSATQVPSRVPDLGSPPGVPLPASHVAVQPTPPLPNGSAHSPGQASCATPNPTTSLAKAPAGTNNAIISSKIAPLAGLAVHGQGGGPTLARTSTTAHTPTSVSPQARATPPAASPSAQRTMSIQEHLPNPPAVPPHFEVLVQVLREQGSAVDRCQLSSKLLTRQRDVLKVAGTYGYSKPFVRYFKAAFKAGIITSETGKVCLSAQYR